MSPESIVIPTYNGVTHLAELCAKIKRLMPSAEIVIVDDNSPDGTGKIADELAASRMEIRAIHRPMKLGVGSAVRDGVEMSTGTYVSTIDVDAHHPVELIPTMFQLLRSGWDIVVASRYMAGAGFSATSKRRWTVNLVGNRLARLITGIPVSDITGGFRAYLREVFLKCYDHRDRMGEFNLSILRNASRMGFRICEIPYKTRHKGESNLAVVPAYLKTLLRGSRVPVRS